MNLWFEWNGVWLCAPPKCGGTALYCAALGIDPKLGRHVFSEARNRTEFVADPKRPAYLAVRDPVERFASLWRDKCRGHDENYPWLHGLRPHELMDLIEAEPQRNAHWFPQRYWWREGVQTVPYAKLSKHVGLPLIRVNTTKPDRTPMPVERIKRHYREDYSLQ